jgi:hypothetical protein
MADESHGRLDVLTDELGIPLTVTSDDRDTARHSWTASCARTRTGCVSGRPRACDYPHSLNWATHRNAFRAVHGTSGNCPIGMNAQLGEKAAWLKQVKTCSRLARPAIATQTSCRTWDVVSIDDNKCVRLLSSQAWA